MCVYIRLFLGLAESYKFCPQEGACKIPVLKCSDQGFTILKIQIQKQLNSNI